MDKLNVYTKEKQTFERINDVEFKMPLHPAPKNRKKILPEEIYVKNLQAIIERDFFPNLEELREKVDFIRANETNNIEKLQELREKFVGRQQKHNSNEPQSPATFDTPIAHGSCEIEDPKCSVETTISFNAEMSDDLTLDAFMVNYTSEDNKSFEDIMDKAEALFKLKHPWLFDAETKHNSTYAPNLALLSTEMLNKAKMLSLFAVQNKNKDIRPKNLENWTYKTYNSLMYVPDGVEQSSIQLQHLAKCKKKEVAYINTRFQENPFNEEINQSAMLEASAIQAYKKEGKVGVDGKDLNETAKVNGYSYLRTPSPAVGVDASPLMTWGEIEGTPYQLDGSESPLLRYKNTPGPSYQIPKASERDEILLRLNEKLSHNHKTGKQQALSTARAKFSTPKQSSLQRLSAMSPAAQRFLRSNSKGHRDIGAAIRTSYIPSKQYMTPTKTIKTPSDTCNKTPQFSGITDNLLNFPKRSEVVHKSQNGGRKCAADFF